jgi:hypothetical protein
MDRPSWMQVDDVFADVIDNNDEDADNSSTHEQVQTSNEQTVPVYQQSVSQLQPDEEFSVWLRDRQSDLGTPKADLIASTESVPMGKHNMYKLKFEGRTDITGWVPEFVVKQYWSKQKLDAWNI